MKIKITKTNRNITKSDGSRHDLQTGIGEDGLIYERERWLTPQPECRDNGAREIDRIKPWGDWATYDAKNRKWNWVRKGAAEVC